jgi:hypothetical protein
MFKILFKLHKPLFNCIFFPVFFKRYNGVLKNITTTSLLLSLPVCAIGGTQASSLSEKMKEAASTTSNLSELKAQALQNITDKVLGFSNTVKSSGVDASSVASSLDGTSTFNEYEVSKTESKDYTDVLRQEITSGAIGAASTSGAGGDLRSTLVANKSLSIAESKTLTFSFPSGVYSASMAVYVTNNTTCDFSFDRATNKATLSFNSNVSVNYSTYVGSRQYRLYSFQRSGSKTFDMPSTLLVSDSTGVSGLSFNAQYANWEGYIYTKDGAVSVGYSDGRMGCSISLPFFEKWGYSTGENIGDYASGTARVDYKASKSANLTM